MKANIFIAWGGNKSLAEGVSRKLEDKYSYRAQVGGDSQEHTYISSQIIEQIKRSSGAILLVQNTSENNASIELKSNLMFEWGYLIAKLKPKNIHVFLIDLSTKDLPSDLAGSWVQEIKTNNRTQNEVIEEITSIFNTNFKEEYADKLQIMENWKDNKELIFKHYIDPIYTEREIAHLILHSFQVAYYYDELKLMKENIKLIRTKDKVLNKVKEVVNSAMEFYIITDNQKINSSYNEFNKIIEKLETEISLGNEDRDINYWLHIIKYDFIGLCYMFMATTDDVENEDESLECYESACQSFNNAIDIINEYALENITDNEYLKLWEGYIYRNLAVINSKIGDAEETKRLFGLAKDARKCIWNYFSSNTNNLNLINNFELEYCLIKIEEMKYFEIPKDKKKRNLKSIKTDLYDMERKHSRQYVLLELVKKEFEFINANKDN